MLATLQCLIPGAAMHGPLASRPLAFKLRGD